MLVRGTFYDLIGPLYHADFVEALTEIQLKGERKIMARAKKKALRQAKESARETIRRATRARGVAERSKKRR